MQPKEIPSCLIPPPPRLLVVFAWQLEILVTALLRLLFWVNKTGSCGKGVAIFGMFQLHALRQEIIA